MRRARDRRQSRHRRGLRAGAARVGCEPRLRRLARPRRRRAPRTRIPQPLHGDRTRRDRRRRSAGRGRALRRREPAREQRRTVHEPVAARRGRHDGGASGNGGQLLRHARDVPCLCPDPGAQRRRCDRQRALGRSDRLRAEHGRLRAREGRDAQPLRRGARRTRAAGHAGDRVDRGLGRHAHGGSRRRREGKTRRHRACRTASGDARHRRARHGPHGRGSPCRAGARSQGAREAHGADAARAGDPHRALAWPWRARQNSAGRLARASR